MKLLVINISLILLFVNICKAQSDSTYDNKFQFIPLGLHFKPLKANIQEARIGIQRFCNNSSLKIDIGNSIDLLQYDWYEHKIKLTCGIDFIAYGYSIDADGFRLQIDAIDGLFGGNLTCSKVNDSSVVFTRLRIMHMSAHFVDGHFFDPELATLLPDRYPRVYTKDFGELILAYSRTLYIGRLYPYFGISYATLIRPSIIKRFSYLVGTELSNDRIFKFCFNYPLSIYCAYQLTLIGAPSYQGSNNFQVGSKFGYWEGKGITIYVSYYSGRHIFAEYFDKQFKTYGIGFTVDFY